MTPSIQARSSDSCRTGIRKHRDSGDRTSKGSRAGSARVADHDRSRTDRDPVHRHVVHLVPDRRRDGAGDPRRAGQARPADRERRGLQPAVHDARHDHAAAVRDAAVRRLRQCDHAGPDRRPGRRVPAAEHVQLLAVPVRRADGARRVPDAWWRGGLRLDRLLAAVERGPLAGCRRRPVDHGSVDGRSGHDPRVRSTSSPRSSPARARDDDVPDADLHLEHPGHVDPGADRVPDPGRRAADAGGGSSLGGSRLRCRERRADAVAAPVLVLRASRGLHHRAAVLRHHHRDPAGVQPQARLRLHRPGRLRPWRSLRCRSRCGRTTCSSPAR